MAVLAVAAMLRREGLGEASYDFDQAFCWKMTTFPLGEIAARAAADNHPPLYFSLLWFWSRTLGDSLLALRSLSVVFGLATVVAAYLLARRIERSGIHGNLPDARRPTPDAYHAALAAAALVALSHLQIFWARQVRMYAAGAFLAVASSYLLLRAVQAPRPRWRDYAWYALAATALAYTHYFGLFILAGQFLYAVGAALVGRGAIERGSDGATEGKAEGGRRKAEEDGEPANPKSKIQNRKLAAALAAFSVVGALWLPWLPVFLAQRAQVSESFWSGTLSWEHLLRVGADLSGFVLRGSPCDSPAAWAATLALAVLPVAMLCWGRGGLRLIGLCALVTFDGALCASVADRNIISPHYFVFAQALLLCGLPPLVTQLAAARLPLPAALTPALSQRQRESFSRQREAPLDTVRLRVGLHFTRPANHGGPALASSLGPPYTTNAAFSTARGIAAGAALAALVGGAAWLCSQHAGRQASNARRPGVMAALGYLADVRKNGEPLVVANPMVQIAAAAHAPRDAAPRVLSTSGSFPYFQGTAVLRSDEYLSPGELDAMAPRRVWAIDAVSCFAGTWKVELSDDWVDVAEEVFPGPPSPSSRIIVRCYERRRQAER